MFLLIRAKRGVSPASRLDSLLSSQLFDTVKARVKMCFLLISSVNVVDDVVVAFLLMLLLFMSILLFMLMMVLLAVYKNSFHLVFYQFYQCSIRVTMWAQELEQCRGTLSCPVWVSVMKTKQLSALRFILPIYLFYPLSFPNIHTLTVCLWKSCCGAGLTVSFPFPTGWGGLTLRSNCQIWREPQCSDQHECESFEEFQGW